MHARAMEGNFFMVATKRCAKLSSLSWYESDLKNKFLKNEKSENKLLKSGFGGKISKIFFSQKMHACARGGELFFF